MLVSNSYLLAIPESLEKERIAWMPTGIAHGRSRGLALPPRDRLAREAEMNRVDFSSEEVEGLLGWLESRH